MAMEAEHRATYQHIPFKDDTSIRLLILHPAWRFKSAIKIDLIEVSFSELPDYVALSYVWGIDPPTSPVICNGQELKVTQNCYAALQRLRFKRKRRILWIDAICIDQTSDLERGHQVKLMGDVYSKARSVAIWMGETDDLLCLALSFLNHYDTLKSWKLPRTIEMALLYLRYKITEWMWQSTTREEWELLRALGSLDWFQRLWTVQEYCLSADASFICGKSRLKVSKCFPTLKRFFKDMTEEPAKLGILLLPPHIQAYSEVFEGARAELMSGAKSSLAAWQLLASGRSQIALDPKDSIYGLQGLLQKQGVDLPDPDYSTTVDLVYTNTTRAIIKHDKCLSVLLETDDGREHSELPSWVPTWNSTPHHGRPYADLHSQNFHCSGSSASIFNFSENKREITVRGVAIDHIKRQASCSFPIYKELFSGDKGKDVLHRIIKSSLSCISFTASEDRYPTGEAMSDVLHHLLSYSFQRQEVQTGINMRDSRISLNPTKEDHDKWLACHMTSNLDSTPPQQENDQNIIADKIGKQHGAHDYAIGLGIANMGSNLFQTSEGYLGKGPTSAQAGDVILLISGLCASLVARKVGDTYQIVGGAYIHGIMNGEKWPDNEKDLVDIVIS